MSDTSSGIVCAHMTIMITHSNDCQKREEQLCSHTHCWPRTTWTTQITLSSRSVLTHCTALYVYQMISQVCCCQYCYVAQVTLPKVAPQWYFFQYSVHTCNAHSNNCQKPEEQLYQRISQVCCCLYCYKCVAAKAANEWYFFQYSIHTCTTHSNDCQKWEGQPQQSNANIQDLLPPSCQPPDCILPL